MNTELLKRQGRDASYFFGQFADAQLIHAADNDYMYLLKRFSHQESNCNPACLPSPASNSSTYMGGVVLKCT